MTKIAEIRPSGVPKMVVYYDDKAKNNPYRIYAEGYELTNYGLRKRRKQVNRYADLFSCALAMTQYAKEHNEEKRIK